MDQSSVLSGRRARKRRPVAEKRRIVELSLQPGASVALVARAEGVNANQVFAWRRAFERGELVESSLAPAGLLPVKMAAGSAITQASGSYEPATGSIHLEFAGRALLRIESGSDPTLLRVILESLRK